MITRNNRYSKPEDIKHEIHVTRTEWGYWAQNGICGVLASTRAEAINVIKLQCPEPEKYEYEIIDMEKPNERIKKP